MANGQTRIDILTLEQFRGTLDARLKEAEALLATVRDSATARPPLGTFTDASLASANHGDRHQVKVERVQRLVTAIQAAKSATDVILTNYRTTEARNAAGSAEIASVLGGVDKALAGERNG